MNLKPALNKYFVYLIRLKSWNNFFTSFRQNDFFPSLEDTFLVLSLVNS